MRPTWLKLTLLLATFAGASSACAPPKDSEASNGDGDASASGGDEGLDDGTGGSSDEPGVQVYLLFGQSNMWGVAAPEEQDRLTTPNVEVMALTSCSGQTPDEWYPASPPLHGCIGSGNGNPGLGPGDTFAKSIAEAYPNDTILLVPGAIPGESIDTFAPGTPAYQSIVSRMQKAQERGTVRALLFHQGESDTGQNSWLDRVNTVVSTLRTDLGIGESVPFIAGELPYDGCCGSGHNPIINQLPDRVVNSHVVSADGLGILDDGLHFDAEANREFGRRYAAVTLPLLSQ